MPIWNEELQQWGYLYHEEVSSFQWLGIRRDLMCDEVREQVSAGYGGRGMSPESANKSRALRELEEKRETILQDLIKVQAAIESVKWVR